MTCLKKNPGFTLIETIVTVAIMSILMLALFELYDQHQLIYNYQEAMFRVVNSGRQSADAVHTYVGQAHRVLDSKSILGNTYSTTNSSLVLEIPSIDANGNVIANTWDYAAFYITGNEFHSLLSPDTASSRLPESKILTDALSNVTFTYDNPDLTLVRQVNMDLVTSLPTRFRSNASNHLSLNFYLQNY